MHWSKPEFKEITLGMEVTGYVNTDEPETVAPRMSVATTETEAPVRAPDAYAR